MKKIKLIMTVALVAMVTCLFSACSDKGSIINKKLIEDNCYDCSQDYSLSLSTPFADGEELLSISNNFYITKNGTTYAFYSVINGEKIYETTNYLSFSTKNVSPMNYIIITEKDNKSKVYDFFGNLIVDTFDSEKTSIEISCEYDYENSYYIDNVFHWAFFEIINLESETENTNYYNKVIIDYEYNSRTHSFSSRNALPSDFDTTKIVTYYTSGIEYGLKGYYLNIDYDKIEVYDKKLKLYADYSIDGEILVVANGHALIQKRTNSKYKFVGSMPLSADAACKTISLDLLSGKETEIKDFPLVFNSNYSSFEKKITNKDKTVTWQNLYASATAVTKVNGNNYYEYITFDAEGKIYKNTNGISDIYKVGDIYLGKRQDGFVVMDSNGKIQNYLFGLSWYGSSVGTMKFSEQYGFVNLKGEVLGKGFVYDYIFYQRNTCYYAEDITTGKTVLIQVKDGNIKEVDIKDRNYTFYSSYYYYTETVDGVNKIYVYDYNHNLLIEEQYSSINSYSAKNTSVIVIKNGSSNKTFFLKQNGIFLSFY